jgi:hypothetical protein
MNHIFFLKTITLDFLKPGHSFQPADSVHSAIERKMDSFKNIYSFDHIIEIIQNSRVNLSVKPIFYSEIYEFIGNSNVKKLESDERFYLRDVKSVQFRKYSSNIYLKLDYKKKYNEKSILNIKMTQLLEKTLV